MGHVQEGDAQTLLHVFQLQLHLLAQLQVQGAQGFVQQEHLRLVDQRPGDGHPLLLSAGEGVHVALAIAPQVHQLQHGFYPAADLCLGHLFQLQAKGDVVKYVQVGEQGVFLEHRVHPALVRGQLGDVPALEEHLPGGGGFKPADDPQGGGFAAARGPQQGDEFLFADI